MEVMFVKIWTRPGYIFGSLRCYSNISIDHNWSFIAARILGSVRIVLLIEDHLKVQGMGVQIDPYQR